VFRTSNAYTFTDPNPRASSKSEIQSESRKFLSIKHHLWEG
jgi:hypothetical protein